MAPKRSLDSDEEETTEKTLSEELAGVFQDFRKNNKKAIKAIYKSSCTTFDAYKLSVFIAFRYQIYLYNEKIRKTVSKDVDFLETLAKNWIGERCSKDYYPMIRQDWWDILNKRNVKEEEGLDHIPDVKKEVLYEYMIPELCPKEHQQEMSYLVSLREASKKERCDTYRLLTEYGFYTQQKPCLGIYDKFRRSLVFTEEQFENEWC